ncbi:MAG: immunoglobulin domain-containing protein [Culicoidibacterales bacterium]
MRYDFVTALETHFEAHHSHWLYAEPAAEGVYAEQHNQFIAAVQQLVLNMPYRVIMNGSHGEMWMIDKDDIKIVNSFDYSATELPQVTKQPESAEVFVGDNVRFSTRAVNIDFYEWEISADNGKTWKATGIIDKDYEMQKVLWSDNGLMIRARFEGTQVVYSNNARLSVYTHIEFTKQPESVMIMAGEVAEFSAEADGRNIKWVWEQRTKAKPFWTIIATDVTSIKIESGETDALDKSEYRCTISTNKETFHSDVAELTIKPSPPVIVVQPNNVNAYAGKNANFTARAMHFTAVEWEKSTDRINWEMTGVYSTDLILRGVTVEDDNTYYRARFEGLGTLYSNFAVLRIFDEMIITQQPAPVHTQLGGEATFSIRGTHINQYRWERKQPDSESWTRITEGPSATQIKLSKLDMTYNNNQIRCAITGEVETIYSDVVMLTLDVPPAPVVTEQPKDAVVYIDTEIRLSGKALNALRYEWEKSFDGKEWSKTYVINEDYVIESATTHDNDTYYRIRFEGSSAVYSHIAHVAVCRRMTVTDPNDTLVEIGATASFSSGVQNADRRVWDKQDPDSTVWEEYDDDIETITFENVQFSQDKTKVRIRAINRIETITSAVAVLNVVPPIPSPIVTKHPQNTAAVYGGEARFMSTADHAVSMQWYSSVDLEEWTALVGETSNELVVKRVTTDDDKKHYIARFKGENPGDYVDSFSAELRVYSAIEVDKHPEDVVVDLDTEVSFIYESRNDRSRNWQYMLDNETTWTNLPNETTNVFTTIATIDKNGMKVRAKLSSPVETVYTNSAFLYIKGMTPKPVVTLQPKDVKTYVGERVVFSSSATHVDTYEWETSNNARAWTPTGVFDQDLVFEQVEYAKNFSYYRARFEGSEIVYSDSALLKVFHALTITQQPENQIGFIDDKTSFEIAGTGIERYIWEQKLSTEWKVIGHERVLVLDNLSEDMNNSQYRCIVSNELDEIVSNVVTLTVQKSPPPEVILHPQETVAWVGDNVVFTADAINKIDKIYWERERSSGSEYNKYDVDSKEFVISNASKTDGNFYYRCVFVGSEEVRTERALLTIKEFIKIHGHPQDVSGPVGGYVRTTVNILYQDKLMWQMLKAGETEWIDTGHNGMQWGADITSDMNGAKIRAKAWTERETVYTNEATITIETDELPIIKPLDTEIFVPVGNDFVYKVDVELANNYLWEKSIIPGEWYPAGTTRNYMEDFVSSGGNKTLRLKATNQNGTTISNECKMTVYDKLTVTSDLKDLNDFKVGDTITMTFSVTNAKRYEWWKLSKGSETWEKISSSSHTINMGSANLSHNGMKFRATAYGQSDILSVDSYVATLTLDLPPTPEIIEHPETQNVIEGVDVTFTSRANNAVEVWWESSRDGIEWKEEWNANTETFVIKNVTTSKHKWYYRARFTSSDVVYSDPAYLGVYRKLSISTQPNDVSTTIGGKAYFGVAIGSTTNRRWEQRKKGETEWTFTGVDNGSITYEPVTADMHEMEVRCACSTPAETIYTDIAKLYVTDL